MPRFIFVFGLISLVLLAVTCTGPPQSALDPPSGTKAGPEPENLSEPASPGLQQGLTDVLHTQTPEGVDPALFAELKAALAVVIQQRSSYESDKSVSWTPYGTGSMVDNLTLLGTGPYTLTWTYRNRGDYDLNGEANIADLTPIGMNFGATESDASWLTARRADGDGNGEINISDVTPIGMNYGSKVAGYRLWGTNELNETWTLAGDIELATLLGNADEPCFRHALPSLDYTYYRLWTYDNSEFEGGWSNFVVAGQPETDTLGGFYEYLQ